MSVIREFELDRLQNFGFTRSGAAIVDALWFHPRAGAIGMVLIVNESEIWKSYIGTLVEISDEANDARLIAEFGAKLPYVLAAAAFPDRFTKENYDT